MNSLSWLSVQSGLVVSQVQKGSFPTALLELRRHAQWFGGTLVVYGCRLDADAGSSGKNFKEMNLVGWSNLTIQDSILRNTGTPIGLCVTSKERNTRGHRELQAYWWPKSLETLSHKWRPLTRLRERLSRAQGAEAILTFEICTLAKFRADVLSLITLWSCLRQANKLVIIIGSP